LTYSKQYYIKSVIASWATFAFCQLVKKCIVMLHSSSILYSNLFSNVTLRAPHRTTSWALSNIVCSLTPYSIVILKNFNNIFYFRQRLGFLGDSFLRVFLQKISIASDSNDDNTVSWNTSRRILNGEYGQKYTNIWSFFNPAVQFASLLLWKGSVGVVKTVSW
jgi:hypothetical protein